MCNLYSQTKPQDAMRHVFDDMVEADAAGTAPGGSRHGGGRDRPCPTDA